MGFCFWYTDRFISSHTIFNRHSNSYFVMFDFEMFRPFYKYILVLILFAAVNCLFSTSPFESAYKWLKILEFFLFAIFIAKQNSIKMEVIIKTLFYSSVLFSLIGIFQFLKNGTANFVLARGEKFYYSNPRNCPR